MSFDLSGTRWTPVVSSKNFWNSVEFYTRIQKLFEYFDEYIEIEIIDTTSQERLLRFNYPDDFHVQLSITLDLVKSSKFFQEIPFRVKNERGFYLKNK